MEQGKGTADAFGQLVFLYELFLIEFSPFLHRKDKVNLTWKDLAGKKEDRAKLIEDSASIENFNELAGELEEFLKDRLNVLGE